MSSSCRPFAECPPHTKAALRSPPAAAKPKDLYFPKPFNDEQVRIVQLLEVSEGVAVQGPPGTGKTHTIANVICHYLATGRRVLVTSMKDPALAVLQEQLPPEIRPLAISLLTSEQDGMKQFEHAIHKIASEVQSLDQSATERVIRQLEDTIDALHAKLARVDRATGDWAQKNLERVRLDDEEIDPQDAAREVVDSMGQYEWIPDRLGVGPELRRNSPTKTLWPCAMRAAPWVRTWRTSGARCRNSRTSPTRSSCCRFTRTSRAFRVLSKGVEDGHVPPLADSSQETLAAAQALVADIEQLKQLRDEVIAARKPWTVGIRETLRTSGQRDLIGLFEALGGELKAANDERKALLHRPVVTPPEHGD